MLQMKTRNIYFKRKQEINVANENKEHLFYKNKKHLF